MKNIRNNSIDMFRMICAVMVVIIHTNLMIDINYKAGFLMTQVFPRIAVPFFFCVSGYFYTKKLISKESIFIGTIKKLLLVYSAWSVIYFAKDFAITMSNRGSLTDFALLCVKNFFINGSSFQLWYFPALFFSICLATIFNNLKLLKFLAYTSLVLYIIGCLGTSYYTLGNSVLGLSNLINSSYFLIIRRVVFMGVPFFMLGYWLNEFETKIDKMSLNFVNIGIIISSLLFITEIYLVVKLNLQSSVIMTIFLYFLLIFAMIFLLKNPFENMTNMAYRMRGMGNFLFYTHPIFMLALSRIWNKVFNVPITTTILFLFTIIVSAIIGYVLVKINNKYLNKLIY